MCSVEKHSGDDYHDAATTSNGRHGEDDVLEEGILCEVEKVRDRVSSEALTCTCGMGSMSQKTMLWPVSIVSSPEVAGGVVSPAMC
jgi:hypothetical protein